MDTPEPGLDRSGDRLSGLCAAMLRIGASLDVDTVLEEIVGSACRLTDARCGAITTIDASGQPLDYVFTGLTPDERRALSAWPSEALQLFAHLRDLPGPLRLPDLPSLVRSLGFASIVIPCKTFQGTPMRHRGEYVGSFFLGDKAGGVEFTDEDEQLLALFAAQAAAAIVNSRTHRDERRARADLEALIDTSPVGVVVFDAATGAPKSMNREAVRIVARLHSPEQSPMELLEVLTARRADGREVSLDELSAAERLRGEEIELSLPDGQSVRTLINATPIRSDGDTIESVVVTLQDLAPLEELERSRSEFLKVVTHELRTPVAAIKGSTATVLRGARVIDPAETSQFLRIIDQQADRLDALIGDLLDAGRIDTGTLRVEPAPVDLAALVDQARNTFINAGGTHTLRIDLPPDLPPVLADEQRIVQVMNNLLANAARHSPAASTIAVAAVRDRLEVAVSVTDEGEGVAADQLPLLFQKHAGSGGPVRAGGHGGSGLGLAICEGLVEAHGGRIRAERAEEGRGMRFTFTVPLAEDTHTGTVRKRSRPFRAGLEKVPVLVVDDDPQALRYMREALMDSGYAPVVTGDPAEIPGLVRSNNPRLVLLDLMLPGNDGIVLLETLPELADLPVIFISAYGRDETIAKALEIGAEDYIVKPFSPTELSARVGAALRRRAVPERFVLGDLTIHHEQRRVTKGGRAVRLTTTEYELLRVLSVNAGRVVTYESLLQQVWSNRDTESLEPVRSFVRKLRRKLGDEAANPTYILNERGVGYRMATPIDG